MARKTGRERNNLLGLLASFFVIFFGLMACIVITLVGGQNDKQGFYIALAVFGLIALIPMGSLRPSRPIQPGKKSGSRLAGLFRILRRKERAEPQITTWKRKRTNFIPTPHGSEYTTFVRERKSDQQSG